MSKLENEKAKEILGFDPSSYDFSDLDNKNLSLKDVFGSNSDNSTEYDEFLKERNFDTLFGKSDTAFKEEFGKTLMSAESRVGKISVDTIQKEGITGLIRSKETESNLLNLFEFIELQNDKIKFDPIKTNIPYKEITFNKILEGKFERTQIAYDTEANEEGHTIFNTAVNYTAKRIVVGYLNDKFEITNFKDENWTVYFLGTDNLWEAVFLAGIEALIAVNLTSTLEQGSIETLSVYQKIFSPIIDQVQINSKLLAEELNNQRRENWLCHYNFYDINQLKTNYAYKKGKRKNWNIIKSYKTEFIKIRHQTHDLFKTFKVKLGNTFVGFRFLAKSNTRFSEMGMPNIVLAPSQSRSYSFVTGIDTFIMALAGRFPKLGLIDLSKGLAYEKIELEEEKIFSKEDLKLDENFNITDKLQYNILDCLATIAVYGKISYHFKFKEIGEEISKSMNINLDLTSLKNWKRPFSSSIMSSATPAKFTFEQYLMVKTGLSRHEIEANLELTHKHLENFRQTYLGAKNEAFVYGKVDNDPKNNKYIMFLDFLSQYPSAARLVQAELQAILASSGVLVNYLDYKTKDIEKDFWKVFDYTVNCKKKNQVLSDSFCENIIGNVSLGVNNLPFPIRTFVSKRQQDIILTEKHKSGKDHRLTITLFDLLASCEYAHLINHIPIRKLKANIKFIKAERLLLGKTPKFGKEFYTKVIQIRQRYQEQLEQSKKEKQPEHIITNLKAVEQNIKYFLNTASYGIFVEGSRKDYFGKFYIPSIGSAITGICRYLNTSSEILYRMHGGIPIYTDTDSIQALATKETHAKVFNFFKSTIILQNELDYGVIKRSAILGRKKWGILNEKGEIHYRIHGIGQYKDAKPAYKELYRLYLTTNKSNEEIARLTVKHHPIYQSITYKKASNTIIKSITKFLKKGELIKEFKYNKIPLYIYQLKNGKDYDYLIINSPTLTKGQFGSYLKLDQFTTNKVVFAIFAPCNFIELVKSILVKPEKESGIIRKVKYKYSTKLNFLHNELSVITDSITPNYDINPYSEIPKDIDTEPFDHLANETNFNDFFTTNKKRFGNALKKTFESLCLTTIEKLTPKVWLNLGETILEEGVTPEDFIETFSIKARLKSLFNYHMDQLIQKDTTKVDLYSQVSEKLKLQKKFTKLLQFDKSRFHRNRKILPSKPYDIMMSRPYNRRLRHDLLKEYNNKDIFTSDTIAYSYTGNLPDMDFAANLLSEQNKYYSQCIINTALAGSIIWVKTHFQKLSTIQEKINKYLHAKKEDKITLPCPKTNQFILIPLKILRKIPLDQRIVDKEAFTQIFDQTVRKRLLMNNIVKETKAEPLIITKPNGKTIHDTKLTTYEVIQPSKFEIYLKRNYKHEWTEVEWLEDKITTKPLKWSVSIEKRSDLDYNAMLSIKIVVDQSELGKRTLMASLRINPSSKNLHNIDLFEVSINDLDKGAEIGKILLEKLFKANLLTYFDKKRATHLEDFQEASKPYEAYKTTYLTIAHSNIQRLIPKLRPKLGIAAYTIDMKTLCPTDILIPHLHSWFRNRFHEIYKGCKDMNNRLQKMQEISVGGFRYSLGFAIQNKKDKYAIAIYGKDFYQHLSKIVRVSKHEKLTDLPPTKIRHLEELKEIENDKHTLRLEITLFGWKQIHTKGYYGFLDKLKQLILRADLRLKNKSINLDCKIQKCRKQEKNQLLVNYLENHVELTCPTCGDTTSYSHTEINKNPELSDIKTLKEMEIKINKEIDIIEKEIEKELGHSNGFAIPNSDKKAKTDRKTDKLTKLTKSLDYG